MQPTSLPYGAREAFRYHRKDAKKRGIPFLLTFEEWWAWWQVDNRWEYRGNRAGALVMARHNDIGPYSLQNVYCSTFAENLNLGRFRPVLTPGGRFGSVQAAAEAFGISRYTAGKWARRGFGGWGYEGKL